MTQEDHIYLLGILRILPVFGYKAAWELLMDEGEKRSEATLRQCFSLDGALMEDIRKIAEEYPRAMVKFSEDAAGDVTVQITLKGDVDSALGDEVQRRIQEAFDKRNQMPHAPWIRSNAKFLPRTISTAEDEQE